MNGNNFKGVKRLFFLISCLAYLYYLWQDAGAKHRINLTNFIIYCNDNLLYREVCGCAKQYIIY